MPDAPPPLAPPPVGAAVLGWRARPPPPRTAMAGRLCRVEPLDPARHGGDLFAANQRDTDGRNFTYLSQEPFADLPSYRAWLERVAAADDPLFHAIVAADSGKAVGVAAFMRIDRAHGVIEVGNINYSPLLQRRPAATEAMFLMMRRAFAELGYRRYEWKCDALNAASRAAALRLGFRYEGLFRQALVTKGRNRDTAWFSIIDGEWPALHDAFTRWLAPENFDATGRQRIGLPRMIAVRRGDEDASCRVP